MPPAPTVPSLGTRPGRQGVRHWAVSSGGASNRGFFAPLPPGPDRRPRPARFSRWLPDRAEALTVRRSAALELALLFPPRQSLSRSLGPEHGGILGRSLGAAMASMDRNPGSAGFAAPGPKPGPARRSRRRSAVSAGGDARTEVPPSAWADPGSEDPVSGLSGSAGPKAAGSDGRFTKHAALALAKGQARSFRLAAASSAALPSASIRLAARRQPARSQPGLWLGRRPSVAGRPSRPHRKAVMDSESLQAQSACG